MTNLNAGLLRLLLGFAFQERAEAVKRKVKRALTLAVLSLGVALALGGTTIVLLAQLSVFLMELHLGRGNALLITAAGAAILAVAFGYLAWSQLLQVFDPRARKRRLPKSSSAEIPKDPLWNLAGALAVGIIAGASRGRDSS
jgi:hypothetical protein